MSSVNAPYSPYAARRERPLGVAILAVLIGIFGAFLLIGSILLFLFGTALYGEGQFLHYGAPLVAGLILFIVAIILLAVATGLWDLRLWALVVSIIVVGFLWLGDLVAGQIVTLGSLVLILLLVYLVLVRHHFS